MKQIIFWIFFSSSFRNKQNLSIMTSTIEHTQIKEIIEKSFHKMKWHRPTQF